MVPIVAAVPNAVPVKDEKMILYLRDHARTGASAIVEISVKNLS